MATKTRFGKSIVWNTAGLITEMAAGFIVLPFLLHRLGEVTYGVWLVLSALTSYFGLLDLGIRAAVGRQVAFHNSKGDQASVNQVISCGLALLTAFGAVAILILLAGEGLFLHLFGIPADLTAEAGTTLKLIAIHLCLFLISTVFDAALWGLQRFDLLNMVEIPAAVLRVVFTFVLVGGGAGLVGLGTMTVGLTAAVGLAKGVLSFRADPGLRIGFSQITRAAFREVLGFGSWNFVRNIARVSRKPLLTILIGAMLGLAYVPAFTIADRLTTAIGSALAAIAGVFTPHSTGLHASGQHERQRRLLLVGGLHTGVLAAILTGFLLALGEPLIQLWVGHGLGVMVGTAYLLLVVLGIGELLPNTQGVSSGVLQATGRHRSLAIFGLIEAAMVCGLAWLLMPSLGLMGAGIALAVSAFMTRGIAPLIQSGGVVGVTVYENALNTVLLPLTVAVVPTTVVGLAVVYFPPTGFFGLIVYSAGFMALSAISYVILLGGPRVVWKMFENAGANRPTIDPPVAVLAVSGDRPIPRLIHRGEGPSADRAPNGGCPMLVSVVIPTYNYGRFVGEAIDSALTQTHPPIEVIVVDDGSTDDTRERVAAYGDRVRYVYQTNKGLSEARNTGIREARGDAIALLDSDDAFHPRKLEHQVRCLTDHPDVALVGTGNWTEVGAEVVDVPGPVQISRMSLAEVVLKVPFCPSSVLLKRACVEAVGYFDPGVSAAADHDYWIRATAKLGVACLGADLTFYRLHPNSMSRNVGLMVGHERLVLHKAVAMPELAGRPLFRRKVWGYFHYVSGDMHAKAGDTWGAVRHLVRSLLAYPLPYSRREVRYPFGRLRLLLAAFLKPKREAKEKS